MTAKIDVQVHGPGNWMVSSTIKGRRWSAYGPTVEQALHQLVINLSWALERATPVDLVKR